MIHFVQITIQIQQRFHFSLPGLTFLYSHYYYLVCRHTLSSPYLQFLHPQFGFNQLRTENIFFNSKKFQKAKCEFAMHQKLFIQYLHCVCIYLHVVTLLHTPCNPQVILIIQEIHISYMKI